MGNFEKNKITYKILKKGDITINEYTVYILQFFKNTTQKDGDLHSQIHCEFIIIIFILILIR